MSPGRTNLEVVGASGFEPPTSWSRTEESQKRKSFLWYRIGTKTGVLRSLQLNLT